MPYMAPLSQKQLKRLADKQLAAAMAAAKAPIISAQQTAARQRAAQQAALQGFGLAAGKMMSGIGPALQQGGTDAANEEAQLAKGFSGAAADRIGAQVAKDNAFIQQQSAGAAPTATTDAPGVGNALYDLGGYVPATSIEEQAAAGNRFGEALPAIQVEQTRNDLDKALAQGKVDDQQYVQALLDLAAKAPQMRQEILQQLYQNERDKEQVRIQEDAQRRLDAQFGEQQLVDRSRIGQENRRLQQEDTRLGLEQAGLKLRRQSQAESLRKAEQDGRRIDSSASHAAGYLIDRDGNPILDKRGKRIPVYSASSGSGKGGTKNNRAYQEAVGAARSMYNSSGLIEPFAQAQRYLVQRYGITRAQARKALVAAGWKPDGRRPKKHH